MAFWNISNLEKEPAPIRSSMISTSPWKRVNSSLSRLIGLRQDHSSARMIAGFETPDDGSIEIDGRRRAVEPEGPNQRNIGMVFQAYALFPQYDRCTERLVPPARFLGKSRLEIDATVEGNAEPHPARPSGPTATPYQMSGGQQQRVALARALRHRRG
ncbi:ATP-binding cassette domain-containing protein, partial [Brucella abortus]|nr:ATP-binding cassette domain-containing protein [Brucella abortus]